MILPFGCFWDCVLFWKKKGDDRDHWKKSYLFSKSVFQLFFSGLNFKPEKRCLNDITEAGFQKGTGFFFKKNLLFDNLIIWSLFIFSFWEDFFDKSYFLHCRYIWFFFFNTNSKFRLWSSTFQYFNELIHYDSWYTDTPKFDNVLYYR